MKREIFNIYVEKICDYFEIERKDLFAKDKKNIFVTARYFLYYACSKRPMRTYLIQEFMSDNGYEISHSSIIRGKKEMGQKVRVDKDYRAFLSQLKECNTH